MFKFIHIGDVHLDTTFYSKEGSIREKLRDSLRESFLEVIEVCIKEQVDALLIAGDLFDNHQLSFQTEELLIQSFKKLEQHHIKVFYATGNHDPGEARSRVNLIQWPKNVTVFSDDEVREVEVLNPQGEVVAKIISVGHKTNRESRNLIQSFPIKKEPLLHIGLVHAMITNASGVERHDRYLPCTKEDLKEKGYDYWALGHIHQYQSIDEDDNIYYSGNLQGRHPRETGEKGGLLVTIEENGKVKVEFKCFAKIIWSTLLVNQLQEIQTYHLLKEHLIGSITSHLGGEASPPKGDGILRIELTGTCPLKEELQQEENIRQMEEDLKYHFNLLGVEIKTEDLLPLIKVEDYREGENVLARTLALLEEVANSSDESNELIQRLLKLTFANKKIKTNNDKIQYINKLLIGLQEEAVERMVGEGK